MVELATKTCTRCSESKPTDRFGKNQHGNPRAICKPCEATEALTRYIEKREAAGEIYMPRLVETAPEGHRTCRQCGKAYPDTREYFGAYNEKKRMYGTCKPCLNLKAKQERDRLRLEVIAYYSKGAMKCECCGESHLRFLTIDHMHGGGRQHLKKIGPSRFYGWLKRNGFPEGFRVLCFNCNAATAGGKQCPHEIERDGIVDVMIPTKEMGG